MSNELKETALLPVAIAAGVVVFPVISMIGLGFALRSMYYGSANGKWAPTTRPLGRGLASTIEN